VPEKEFNGRILVVTLVLPVVSRNGYHHGANKNQEHRHDDGEQRRVDNEKHTSNNQDDSATMAIPKVNEAVSLIWVLKPDKQALWKVTLLIDRS
jgi:hypothetical protein